MRLIKGLITAAIAMALLAVPAGALAKRSDRNHDRIPDKWERAHHLSTRVNVARRDPDKDGLTNLSEFRHNTDPQSADTDSDGIDDGNEVRDHTNPDSPDSNQDGVTDDQEIAGTVASLDSNNLLTIQLPADGAGTVSGTVNDQTKIECDDSSDGQTQQPATATAADDGSDDGTSHDGSNDSQQQDSSSTTPTTTDTTTTTTTPTSDDNQTESSCTAADLKPGARVHEAKLMQAADGSMVFSEIKLIPAAS